MKQRLSARMWHSPRRPGHRPRVLVEDDRTALAISDFVAFQDAGFDVAFCSGPGQVRQGCPLLRGQECDMVAGADVVLHRLGSDLRIAEAIRARHPGMPVVVEQRRRDDGSLEPVPEGCVPAVFACSVNGQLDAVRAALAARRA